MKAKPWIKEERRKKAEEHAADMQETFGKDIEHAIKHSTVYRGTCELSDKPACTMPDISIAEETTDACIRRLGNGCCALNFASYKHAGGGFIIGAMAQEEALCHASTLYNVISSDKFTRDYDYNRNHTNHGLYTNFAIFSPYIIFEDGDSITEANIITCPAPNLSAFNGSPRTALHTLKERIKFILDIAEANKQERLVLGAFGCGVFKNDPADVARTFKELLPKYSFKEVTFAVPSGPNLEAFKETFKQ